MRDTVGTPSRLASAEPFGVNRSDQSGDRHASAVPVNGEGPTAGFDPPGVAYHQRRVQHGVDVAEVKFQYGLHGRELPGKQTRRSARGTP